MDETCSTLTSYQGLFPVEKQTFLDMKFRGHNSAAGQLRVFSVLKVESKEI